MTLEQENIILRKELKEAREKLAKLTQANESLVFRVGARIEDEQLREHRARYNKAQEFKRYFR